jgi:hypothetical protein
MGVQQTTGVTTAVKQFGVKENRQWGIHSMVYFLPMISLEDDRWSTMTGGYKTLFDPGHYSTDLKQKVIRQPFGESFGTNFIIRGTWDTHHSQLFHSS